MKKIRKDIEISDLIYKSLRGETSKSEDELLEAWCLEPRNRKLFMELREADYLYEGVADMYNVDKSICTTEFKEYSNFLNGKAAMTTIAINQMAQLLSLIHI